jgi:hypothetical protein
MLAGLRQHAPGSRPRPDQIAHRLVGGVRHPHRGQLACPVQPGQRGRIAAAGLPSPGRRARLGISDGATMLHSWPSPSSSRWNPVTARTGPIAEVEPPVASLQPLHQAVQRLQRARDISPIKRTSPPRPDSAIAADVVLLWASSLTNVVSSMRPSHMAEAWRSRSGAT